MKRLLCVCTTMLLISLVFCLHTLANELFVGTAEGYPSLTSAVAAAAPGDVIYLATGVYAEPSEVYPIDIDKPITIIGEPGAILQGPPFETILRVNALDVSIENVEFHLLRWGIVDTGDRMSLSNCRFVLGDVAHRVSSCGVWLAGVYNCSVTNCDFIGCGVCVAGPPLSDQSKGLPVLTGLFEVGEDAEFFTTHAFIDNRVNGKPLYYLVNETDLTVPVDAGGVIAARCDNITLSGIDVSDSSMGIQLVYCSGAKVNGVTADRCGIFGVYLAYNDRGTVENVVCKESNHGIDLRAVQTMSVTGSSTIDCRQGIFLSFATNCIVDSCRILRCGNGFFIAAGAQNQLSGSWVEANENGIYVQGENNVLVCGNVVTDNTVAGLRFLRSSGQMVDNDFYQNWVGVLAAEADSLIIWNNSFSSNASAGLYIRDITYAKISGNTFDTPGKVSMELAGSIVDTLIVQNTFRGAVNHVADQSDRRLSLVTNNWRNE